MWTLVDPLYALSKISHSSLEVLLYTFGKDRNIYPILDSK